MELMSVEQAQEQVRRSFEYLNSIHNKNCAGVKYHTNKMYELINNNEAWKGEENINNSRRILVSHIFAIDDIFESLFHNKENKE